MTSVVGRGVRKECEGQAGSRNDTGDDEDDEVLLFNVGHVVSPGKSSAKKAPKLRDDKAPVSYTHLTLPTILLV